MKVAVTTRPIRAALPVSQGVLAEILARMASIRGRASDWGVVDDATRAELLVGQSREAVFAESYYRDGFVEAGAPSLLPGWSFTRTGSGQAQDATATLQSFATGVARITERGLLVENAATNRWLYSEDFANGAWTKSGLTVTANADVGPNGLAQADQLTESSGAGQHYLLQYEMNSKTVSVYIRPFGRTWCAIQIGNALTFFNLSGAGAVGTNGATAARIKRVANGYYRIEAYVASPANENRLLLLASADGVTSYTGDGVSGAFVYGAQAEDGARATSYIPTTSATATRGADGAVFDLRSTAEGAIYVECDTPFSGVAALMTADAGAGIQDYLTLSRSAGVVTASLFQDSVKVWEASRSGFSGMERIRALVAWDNGHVYGAVDGLELTAGTTARQMHLTKLRPGGTFYGGDQLDNFVRRVVAMNRCPTPAERLAMTGA